MLIVIPIKDLFYLNVTNNKQNKTVAKNEEIMKYLDNIIDFVIEVSVLSPYEIPEEILLSSFEDSYSFWSSFNPMLTEQNIFDYFFNVTKNLYHRFNNSLVGININAEENVNPNKHILSEFKIIGRDLIIDVILNSEKE